VDGGKMKPTRRERIEQVYRTAQGLLKSIEKLRAEETDN